MTTDDVKEYLAEHYPGEVFKRTLKVNDGTGFTYRVMESNASIVVVCTEIGDSQIYHHVEVGIAPTTAELKDPGEPWMHGLTAYDGT